MLAVGASLPVRTNAHVEPDSASTTARAAPAYNFVCIEFLQDRICLMDITHDLRGGGESPRRKLAERAR